MTESKFPDVMADVLWSRGEVTFPGFRLTLMFVDEFGMPVRPRGARVDTPSNPEDFQAFADGAAELVRKTVLHMLEEGR